jgi:hypothetical protein
MDDWVAVVILLSFLVGWGFHWIHEVLRIALNNWKKKHNKVATPCPTP